MRRNEAFRKRQQLEAVLKHGHARKGRLTPEYNAWTAMVARCTNPRDARYRYYGGRGITVCRYWQRSFMAFLADVGPRPSNRHSLGRKDNDKGYFPKNVLWMTRSEQALNTQRSHRISVGPKTLTIAEWARELGVNRCVISNRLRRGWTPQESVTSPPKRVKSQSWSTA